MITRVKICGITRVKDLEVALDAGASAIGFNFFPGSPRYLAPRQAKKLLDAIPFMVEAVAVVVDMPPLEVPLDSSLVGKHGGGSCRIGNPPAKTPGCGPPSQSHSPRCQGKGATRWHRQDPSMGPSQRMALTHSDALGWGANA